MFPRSCSDLKHNRMEHLEGEQYSQERNPRAYMSMRDYRSLPWQNQQPLGNPNPNRSMRDNRDQWMSAPVYSFPSTYAPLASPHFASTPQPQQPPTSSPVEQAILNLSKLVDNFIEDQRAVNVQGNQEIEAVENSLNKELDVIYSEIDQEFDILHQSISHQEEELKVELAEAPEELQDAPESCVFCGPWKREEEILPLLTQEAAEEHQDHNLPLPPIDSMYILPTPVAYPTPETPSPKATPFSLLWLHNLS